MSNKKIYCYTYDVLKNKNICKKENLFKIIDLIFNSEKESVNEFPDGNKVCMFSDDENCYSLELLKKVKDVNIDENYMFFRIGREKEIEGAIKRDKITLVSEEILDKKQQEKYNLEICTYILIDKENGIILELFGQFAPSIRSFVNMLNSSLPIKFQEEHVLIRYKNILTEKMINSFKNDGVRLGKIGYTYNIPSPKVLESLGLDVKQIKALEELDVYEVEVTIKNKTKMPLTKSSEKIKFAINAFGECAKDIKDTLVFNGRTGNTESKNYSFEEEEVTYPITISNYKVQDKLMIKFSLDEMAEQIYIKMKSTYENNITDILEYIK